MSERPLTRSWRPTWPCPVDQVWGHLRRGAGDPTYRIASGIHWRGIRTPEGPVTLGVAPAASGIIDARAWGPGASWALDALPTMLGADDDPTGMPMLHEAVRRGAQASPHWRVGRTGLVMESLVPAVIEQKVTGQEAFAGFRALVRRHGEPAPGPGPAIGLWVQPDATTLRAIPSWDWLQLHIDPARSAPIVRAASVAPSLERQLHRSTPDADAALRSIPGIGVWTSAEIRSRAFGDPDAVSFGDYHVARSLGLALVGREVDDDELAVILEPYRGHRYRIQHLVLTSFRGAERHGPRLAPRTHLP